jgi:hypothetical protein
MPLTEAEFTALVDRGCPEHANRRLVVEAFVARRIPLLGGEPYGAASWGYKGEDLVRGTFRIACDACKKELYTENACSRCGAADGVARAHEAENAFPLPKSCTRCNGELLTALAFVPATVIYEGKRADKARTQTAPEDPGFHAFHVECKSCRRVSETRHPCPLCGAQA